jgi:alpha-tubulin suppressor-like RCC1 family protein
MIKDVIVAAQKTPPVPPVYLTEIWATGFNNYGGMGDNSIIDRSSPVQTGTKTDWKIAYNSGNFAAGIDLSGSLWTWGINIEGDLGLGDTISRSNPVRVGTETNWAKVTLGSALKTNGTLWVWGRNTFGQLVTGDTSRRSNPVQVGINTDWKDIPQSTGVSDTYFAIKTDGTLWSWGFSKGFTRSAGTPGIVYEDIHYQLLRSYTMVAMGEYIGYAIRSNGTLWAWGTNTDYNLGDGTTTVRSLPVQIGIDTNWSFVTTAKTNYFGNATDTLREHNFAIKTTGELWGWGANGVGELGVFNTTFIRSIPVQIGPDTNWSRVTAGTSFTVALRTNRTLWSWGSNTAGRLGINLASGNRSSPVQIGTRSDWTQVAAGSSHTLAIRSDNTLWAWGLGTARQLGITVATSVSRSSPTQVGVLSNWTQISAGGSHSMAVASNGTLWTWGANNNGQLGLRDTATRSSPVQVGTRSDWTQVSANGNMSLAIRSDKTLWVWGTNNYGELGLGVSTDRSSPTQVGTLSNWVSGSFGAGHIGLIDANGVLYSAGIANVLGLGRIHEDIIHRSSPTQIGRDTNWNNFSAGLSMMKTDGTIWAIDGSPVQLGTETNWAKVHYRGVGQGSGLKTDRTLWNWSSNHSTYSQLGNDTYKDFNGYYANRIHLIKTDGTLWFKGLNTNGWGGVGDTATRTSPVQVGTLNTWVSASSDDIGQFIKRYS